jgi:hypothetical protein
MSRRATRGKAFLNAVLPRFAGIDQNSVDAGLGESFDPSDQGFRSSGPGHGRIAHFDALSRSA